MTLPEFLRRWLVRKLENLRAARVPDIVIGGVENPYMLRWWVIPRNRFFNIYHHVVLRSDDDRALHDHPWVSASIVVDGEVCEVLPGRRARLLTAGRIVLRGARSAHRLETMPGQHYHSLFITGPRTREWGFHCPQGWKHWKDFTGFRSTGDSTVIGPGCGED